MKLPGHAESYRPPVEFLLSPEEEQKWNEADPDERETDFLPQQFEALRQVPSYGEAVRADHVVLFI